MRNGALSSLSSRSQIRRCYGFLVHVRTIKQPAGRMGRLLHAISQFDFEVVYKPGRLHTDADALSRICAATTLLPSVSSDVLVAASYLPR